MQTKQLLNSFKLQKIMFIIYILVMVVVFIYTLGFMTDYSNLFGMEQGVNESIALFHDKTLQNFNSSIFIYSVIGVVSIIALFALQINKRICDTLAVVIVNVISLFLLITCIISLITLPQIISEYNNVDFTFIGLEDTNFTDTEYVRSYTTFYLGIAIYALEAIAMIIFMTSTIRCYLLARKNIQNLETVGESNE